jgi:hypothetical protein
MLVRMTEPCDDLETVDACAARSVQYAPRSLHRGAKAHIFSTPLKKPAYLAAWKGMLAGESVPDWVSHYAKTSMPATPSKSVAVGSETYTLAWVCKAHDCGGNQFNVLFARPWGLLSDGGKERWLGRRDAAVQAAIGVGAQ